MGNMIGVGVLSGMCQKAYTWVVGNCSGELRFGQLDVYNRDYLTSWLGSRTFLDSTVPHVSRLPKW